MKHIVLLAIIYFSSTAFSIVNIETLRVKNNKQGLVSKLTAQFSKKEGNSNTVEYDTSGYFQHNSEDSALIGLLGYKYGESQKVKNADKLTFHLRKAKSVSLKRELEVFTQYESNEFTQIKHRILAGLGLRAALVDLETRKIFVGVGAFYSNELIELKSSVEDTKKEEFGRGNIYVSLHFNLWENIKFTSVTYFQPRLSRMSDYRLFEEAQVNLQVNKNVSVALSYAQAHDNLPPEAVKKTDQRNRLGSTRVHRRSQTVPITTNPPHAARSRGRTRAPRGAPEL